MWGTAFSFGATMLAGEGDVALLRFLMTIAGVASGCGGAVGGSLLADVVDWDEHATGQRKEGAYTAAAAYASFDESRKGVIAAGKLADLVMIDRDIFTIPPEEIRDAKVKLTIVGGKQVFVAP